MSTTASMTGLARQRAPCDVGNEAFSVSRTRGDRTRSGRSLNRCPMSRLARKSNSLTAGFGGKIRAASALAVLLLSPALSGCILGSERPELNLEVPANYREAPRRTADAPVPAVDWWRGFRSPELTSLMEQAQIFNLDIAVAIAQIVQADAQVGVS